MKASPSARGAHPGRTTSPQGDPSGTPRCALSSGRVGDPFANDVPCHEPWKAELAELASASASASASVSVSLSLSLSLCLRLCLPLSLSLSVSVCVCLCPSLSVSVRPVQLCVFWRPFPEKQPVSLALSLLVFFILLLYLLSLSASVSVCVCLCLCLSLSLSVSVSVRLCLSLSASLGSSAFSVVRTASECRLFSKISRFVSVSRSQKTPPPPLLQMNKPQSCLAPYSRPHIPARCLPVAVCVVVLCFFCLSASASASASARSIPTDLI